MLEHSYSSNHAFFEGADEGTSFRFNNESTRWIKTLGKWQDAGGTRLSSVYDRSWEPPRWYVNDIEYPNTPPEFVKGNLSQRQLEEMTRYVNDKVEEAYERGRKDAGDEQRQFGYGEGYRDGKTDGYSEGYDEGRYRY